MDKQIIHWLLPTASVVEVIETVPSVCVSCWVCETYIVHHQPAMCTILNVHYQIFLVVCNAVL